MMGVFVWLLHAAVATAAAAVPVARPELRVVVLTEGRISLDPRMLAEVTAGARDIWRPYADLTFDVAGDVNHVDHAPLQLVITDRTRRSSEGQSLGWIEFVSGRPSPTITASMTAATALMQASRWKNPPRIVERRFLVRALSRSIAHEIGHYLLGSREHAARGLMRGRLTADDIMESRRANLRLAPSEVEQLRRGFIELARR